MKLSLVLAGLLVVLVAAVSCAPASSSDDLSPLNEVYVFQNEDDERSDRDKRKIGIVKLGVSNGIINFVFGKLDAFLEAKTKALSVLDEGNKAKNAAFEIDPSRSATSEFISKFLAQKAKATSGSVGPLLNAGTTFLSSATQGIAGAFASKFAPLSSLSGGLAGGLSGGSGNGGEDGSSGGDGASGGGGGSGGSNSGSFLTGILGSLSGPGGLSGLSGGSSGGGGGGGANSDEDNGVGVSLDPLPDDFPSNTATSSASAGFGNSAAGVGKY